MTKETFNEVQTEVIHDMIKKYPAMTMSDIQSVAMFSKMLTEKLEEDNYIVP